MRLIDLIKNHIWFVLIATIITVFILTKSIYAIFFKRYMIDEINIQLPIVILMLLFRIVFLITNHDNLQEKSITFKQVIELNNPTLDREYGYKWLAVFTDPNSGESPEYMHWLITSFGTKNDFGYSFDYDKYTYIITAGYELNKLTYSNWKTLGNLKQSNGSKETVFWGKAWLSDSCLPTAMYIYEIPKMFINSRRNSLGSDSPRYEIIN